MRDEGVEARPPLGLEDARHGVFVQGVRAKAVNGLGGKHHEPALAQKVGGAADIVLEIPADERIQAVIALLCPSWAIKNL